MGDGMMVFFGDPEFIDDATHALNCARMALEMLDELSVLRTRWRQMGMFHTLRVRMGINTGYCTVGNFGSSNRMEYTIVGGQVNIASRLENLAEPDSIYISQAVYALIQDLAVCEFVDNTSVKGIHYPIEVYRLTGMKGAQSLAASMMETTRNGFVLKELTYVAESTGAKEREAMKHALRRALDVLERSTAVAASAGPSTCAPPAGAEEK
jgi:class 3 adenylate cyclase